MNMKNYNKLTTEIVKQELQQFIEEACQEFEKIARSGLPDDYYAGKISYVETLKFFLRAKLLQSATLTAEAVKCENLKQKALELCWEIEKFPASEHQTNTVIRASAILTALTEIENKKKEWFDTKK